MTLRNLLLWVLQITLLLGLGVLGHQTWLKDPLPQLSYSEILFHAKMSRDAYLPQEEIQRSYGPSTVYQEFPTSQISAFYVKQGEFFHLAVRGTDNFKNVLYDVRVAPHRVEDIPVHRGFEKAAREVYDWIRATLPTGSPLYLTGHSLGGAVAVLLSEALLQDGYRVLRCFTYGQPKVTTVEGLPAFRHLPLLRVVHAQDPIPTLPPSVNLLKGIGEYRHFGPEIRVSESGEVSYYAEHNTEVLSAYSFWDNLFHLSLEDHRVTKYVQALSEVIIRQNSANPSALAQ